MERRFAFDNTASLIQPPGTGWRPQFYTSPRFCWKNRLASRARRWGRPESSRKALFSASSGSSGTLWWFSQNFPTKPGEVLKASAGRACLGRKRTSSPEVMLQTACWAVRITTITSSRMGDHHIPELPSGWAFSASTGRRPGNAEVRQDGASRVLLTPVRRRFRPGRQPRATPPRSGCASWTVLRPWDRISHPSETTRRSLIRARPLSPSGVGVR